MTYYEYAVLHWAFLSVSGGASPLGPYNFNMDTCRLGQAITT